MTRACTHTDQVHPAWVDANGHMSEAFYVLVFGHATDAVLADLGLGAAYRERTGCSVYTVEAHVRYLREVHAGAELTVFTDVTGADRKRVHLCHTMFAGNVEVATEEIVALHVDQGAGRTVPLPEDAAQRACTFVVPPPTWAGRAIARIGPDTAGGSV